MSASTGAIAIIPARGGSKRIPRKNIRPFLGKPIMAWAIDVARESRLFDHVVVSTDDDEVAEVAQRHGAEVPFRRPAELATDEASTDAMLVQAIGDCQRVYGPFSTGCCVYPTSPFITHAELERGLSLLREHRATSAFPVVKYDFPIQQAFVLDGVRPRAKWPQALFERTQNLEEHHHDAGLFYWFDVQKYLPVKDLYCADCVAFPIPPERCQDINTLEDWTAAELKFELLKGRAR